MKKTAVVFLAFVLWIFVSCAGKTGDKGPSGPTGYNVLYLQEGMNPSNTFTGTITISVSSMYPDSTSTSQVHCGVSSSSGLLHSFFYFPLNGYLPSNASINAAYLTLYCNGEDSSAGGNTVNCYALSEDFMGSATWHKRNTVNNWATYGGTYIQSTGMAGVPVKLNAYNDIPVNPSVIAGWLASPSTNHGLVIVPTNSTTSESVYSFYSNFETTNPELRPMLKIYYSLK